MKNTVIKVLNKEHGKKVIDWFKSQGVDTAGYSGNVTEEDGGTAIYYGVIRDNFSNYFLEEVNRKKGIIMTLPETEKTQLDVCNDIYKPGMEVETCCGTVGVIDDTPFRFGVSDKRVYANNGHICLYDTDDDSYAKIVLKLPEECDMTTDQGRLAYARKHYPIGTVVKSIHTNNVVKLTGEPRRYMRTTLVADYFNGAVDIYHGGKWAEIIKEEEKMETQKLSRAGLKEIHSVACGGWKEILEKYGTTNPLEDYIELTQEQVDTMFNSCTKEQLPIVSKYLKQDDGSVDVKKLDFKDNHLIARRNAGEYQNKAFWLSTDYDWILNFDNKGELCLIPTKKK